MFNHAFSPSELTNQRTGWRSNLALPALLLVVAACDDTRLTTDAGAVTAEDSAVDSGAEELPEGCKVLVNDKDCDKTKRPIVFVHGTVANGDSFEYPAKVLASNGYCPEWIRAVEYHSLIGSVSDAGTGSADGGADAGSAAASFVLDRAETYRRASLDIDRVIDELRAETGFDKVDLAGHSQGSGHGASYAGMHPDKIAHYVHLAGAVLTQDPGDVPTLCLSSIGDRPVSCGTTANVTFQDPELDHSAVSSSNEAALEIYKFLNDGAEAEVKEVACGRPIVIEGRAPTFADNLFLPGAKVEIFELGESPRERGAPAASFTLTEDGKFGPFEATPGVAYEFTLTPPAGDKTRRISHVYMPPFTRSDRLLRLTFETTDRIASVTSVRVNRHDSMAVVIPRSRQKAFLYPRDSLKINGTEVLTRGTTWSEMTGKSSVVAAFYLFDKSLTAPSYGPGDGQTTGESVVSGTFVNSADVYMQATTPAWITVELNGESLKVPNWPSASVGTSVVQLN
jgi:pimeloyl-ACP methyl ester carboxylesterase